MLLKTSQNPKEIYQTINSVIGSSFSLIEKFKYDVFGSPKYKIISMTPSNHAINFEDYSDLVYGAFELRKNGLAFFFRYKNEEYILISHFNQCSFVTNDGFFQFQFSSYNLKLTYSDLKSHKTFITRYYKIKNLDLESNV